ncbi:MAG: T9SS type A sorting domain-containing protein, partial [Bacteroidetes bacterium]|nr:T9SS type A sorting domain-containing protein [Bacteroidota bacterium]
MSSAALSMIAATSSFFRNVTMSTATDFISGTANTFNKVIMPGTTCSIGGDGNTFDTLICNNPGQAISIYNNVNVIVNSLLIIQSDPGFPTSIECNNGTAYISKPTDTVCTDFIYLKNIAATGGAVYFAGDHSVDLGGNAGWNWTRCAPLISNVWPGDCNYDLVTDNFDLLNIGVSFGDTGYVRPAASLSYTAQPCQDWYYQFINAANVKHADCDGNGIVDANDSSAISLNYGLTHPARLMHQDENNSIGTELDFVLPPVIVPGAAMSVPVTLGTNVYPANNIYGIAFTVNYDPAFIQPGTMSVDYASSWVENAGNHLHLEKDFPGSGKTDIAFTRIDHSDVSGYGMIATLHFIASPTANGPFNLSFSHVRVISHNEIEIPIQTGTSTTWVNIEDAGNPIASTVFPNPMTKDAQVIFSNPNHETWYFTMKDLTGRILSQQQITSSNSFFIERKDLNSGVYL